jgi:hypothetical protein
VLFRDYGNNIKKNLKKYLIYKTFFEAINDHSMIRFEPGHKLDEKFYVRQDGII